MAKIAHFIALDFGTASLKAALWTENGKLAAEAACPYPVTWLQPTWAETDAELWWQAACQAVRQMVGEAHIDPRDILGIGVDGQSWTMLPVDHTGKPLRNALLWLDRRSEAEAQELRQLPQAKELVDLSANPLDAAYVTPKLIWFQRHEPALYAATHRFLTSSGFIVQRLTGEWICDYTQAYGYHFWDIRGERWDDRAAGLLNLPLEKMPSLQTAGSVAGKLSRAAADALGIFPGVPVIAGGLDACIGALGAGVVQSGQAVDQGGQAGGILLSVDRIIIEPRLIFSHHALPGQYLWQSGTVGGGAFSWFRQVIGLDQAGSFEELTREASQSPPGANGVIFLPYLSGERTPLWNGKVRGMFYGLSYKTMRADLLRAVLEGCALAVYHNLRIMEGAGVQVSEIFGDGGGAKNPLWCQIKADMYGKPFTVQTLQNGQMGGHTLGLFALTAAAAGYWHDPAECIPELLCQRRTYEPSPERHALYQEIFEQYLKLSGFACQNG